MNKKDQFILTCRYMGLEDPEPEYKFHPTRKWRIDYAWPKARLAIEIEGSIFTYGRHNRATGYVKDLEKYNALAEDNWLLLRYIPQKIDYNQIKRVYDISLKIYHTLQTISI